MSIGAAAGGAADALTKIIEQRRLQQMLDAEIRNREGILAESQRSSQADEAYRQRSLDIQQQNMAENRAERTQTRQSQEGEEAFRTSDPNLPLSTGTAALIGKNPIYSKLLRVSQSLPETMGQGPVQEPETQRQLLPEEQQQQATNERLLEGQRITAENIARDNERQAARDKADEIYRNAMLAKTPRPLKDTVVQTADGPMLVDNETGVARPILSPGGKPVGQALSATERMDALKFGKSEPVIQSIEELSAKINTGSGVIAKMTGGAAKIVAQANLDDDVAEYQSLVAGFTPLVARALGHTGVLTQQDVDSVKEVFPKPGDSKTLRDRKTKRLRLIVGGIQQVQSDRGGGGGAAGGGGPRIGETRTVNGQTGTWDGKQWIMK